MHTSPLIAERTTLYRQKGAEKPLLQQKDNLKSISLQRNKQKRIKMNYIQYSFHYQSEIDTEILNDLLASELAAIGFESFESSEEGLQAYIGESEADDKAVEESIALFPLQGVSISYTKTFVESKNWNEEWEKNYFKPIRIHEQCLIRASFHPEEMGYEHTILINPKMAFGTGNHATTYLMLCEMLPLDLRGKTLLDMGCGTAVLAILAKKKGAARVVGIDIDDWAYRNAQENADLNEVELELLLGGAEKLKPSDTFDYVFANINRNILTRDMAHYVAAMAADATLFMSGFYTEDIPVIEECCKTLGLQIVSHTEQKNWVAIKTIRNR